MERKRNVRIEDCDTVLFCFPLTFLDIWRIGIIKITKEGFSEEKMELIYPGL